MYHCWSKVAVLFVSALNVMQLGVLWGNISVIFTYGIIDSNIPLAFKTVANYQGLFNIICLEEHGKTSHVKNKIS